MLKGQSWFFNYVFFDKMFLRRNKINILTLILELSNLGNETFSKPCLYKLVYLFLMKNPQIKHFNQKQVARNKLLLESLANDSKCLYQILFGLRIFNRIPKTINKTPVN